VANPLDELLAQSQVEQTFGSKFAERWTPEQKGRVQNRALEYILNLGEEMATPVPGVIGGPGPLLEWLDIAPLKAGAMLMRTDAKDIKKLKQMVTIANAQAKRYADKFADIAFQRGSITPMMDASARPLAREVQKSRQASRSIDEYLSTGYMEPLSERFIKANYPEMMAAGPRAPIAFREKMPKKVVHTSRGGQNIAHAEQAVADELIRSGIINRKRPFEVDMTYSTGQFYKHTGLQQPKFKFDINPATEDVIQANVKQMGSTNLPSNSVGSIYLDPPFQIKGPPKPEYAKYNIGERFGEFENIGDAHAMWSGSVNEAARILAPEGILVVKIQDMMAFGKTPVEATESIVKFAEGANLKWLRDKSITKQMPMAYTPRAQMADPARQSITNYLVFVK